MLGQSTAHTTVPLRRSWPDLIEYAPPTNRQLVGPGQVDLPDTIGTLRSHRSVRHRKRLCQLWRRCRKRILFPDAANRCGTQVQAGAGQNLNQQHPFEVLEVDVATSLRREGLARIPLS